MPIVEPWQTHLIAGDFDAAWDLFHRRYRRLMRAAIRRMVPDAVDTDDVFAHVCAALAADQFARLKGYSEQRGRQASCATWLVAVVHNLTIDWLRSRDGRPRQVVPPGLDALQQAIYTLVCLEGHSHSEAYELIRARSGTELAFHEFLRVVRQTQQDAPCPGVNRRALTDLTPDIPGPAARDPAETADASRRLEVALAPQPPDVRVAVQLFVVEGVPAADVARVVGWSDAKTVYNRVYRTLEALRDELERAGIRPGDL